MVVGGVPRVGLDEQRPGGVFGGDRFDIAFCSVCVIRPSSTKLRGKSRVAPAAFSGRGWVRKTLRTIAFSASVRLSSSSRLLSVTKRLAGNSVHFAASSLSTFAHHGLSPQ